MTAVNEMLDTADTVTLEHAGETYAVEKIDPEDPPVDLMEALEDGKAVAACRLLLGDDQWAKFKKSKPKASDLNRLVSKALGTEAGKSGS